MNHTQAREVMRGYMSPRNDAINVYAQTGKVWDGTEERYGLIDEIDAELNLVFAEGVRTTDPDRTAELLGMQSELSRVRAFVADSLR